VIVAGDSAGGNLAAVCALRARDRGGPELALQVLVYPATSGDLTTPSCARYGSGRDTFMTLDEMEWFWAHYVGDAFPPACCATHRRASQESSSGAGKGCSGARR